MAPNSLAYTILINFNVNFSLNCKYIIKTGGVCSLSNVNRQQQKHKSAMRCGFSLQD